MSRLAPDIPELHRVPEAARSLVYVRALSSAIRSRLTWLAGAIVVAFGVGIGATQGWTLFGGVGAVLGTAVGASASIWCFFKVIVPWRARRMLPSMIDQADGHTLDHVRHADESLRRMLDAYSRHEARSTDETTDRRGPGRLP
jgi:type VI protein secretion system component VasK